MTLAQRADRAARDVLVCQRRHLLTAPKRGEAQRLRALVLLRENRKNGHHYPRSIDNALRAP